MAESPVNNTAEEKVELSKRRPSSALRAILAVFPGSTLPKVYVALGLLKILEKPMGDLWLMQQKN